MESNPVLARWLLAHRNAIEARLAGRLGKAAPRASGPEAETLRRFRTFASTALMRGEVPAPALDGLRPDERRVMSLLAAWKESAAELAGSGRAELDAALEPLLAQFRLALRNSSVGRRGRARTNAPRRAVPGAIDRVSDAFFAIDVSGATIVDANPAAGALLGVDRDSLFGLDFLDFVPGDDTARWWSHLDRIAESDEDFLFDARFAAVGGEIVRARARATAFATRGRTLALIMLRPTLETEIARPLSGENPATLTQEPPVAAPEPVRSPPRKPSPPRSEPT